MEIRTVQWFDDKWYRIGTEDGEVVYYPSTTTKLGVKSKPFMAKWRGDVGNREADMRMFESSERGKRIHSAWETLTTGGLVMYQPLRNPQFPEEEVAQLTEKHEGHIEFVRYQDEMIDVWKLQRLVEVLGPKMLGSEMIVYSHKHKEAGTMDNLWEIKEGSYLISGKTPVFIPGGRYVVDLKTGKVVDDDAYLQTSDYAMCCEEMGKGPIVGTMILHTGATTKSGIPGLAVKLRTKEEMMKDYKKYRNISLVWEDENEGVQPKEFDFPAMLKLGK